MLQIIETRLLSVVSHYYLAFLSISMAMFGMTGGAVWVYYRGARFTRESLPYDLAIFAFAYGLSIVASLLLQISHAPVQVVSATMLVLWTELALVMATPFFFAGVVVSLALTRSGFPVGEVYAVDLVGASLGCLGVLGLLGIFDAPSAILFVGAVGALGAGFFARSATRVPPKGGNAMRHLSRWAGAVAAVLFGAAVINASTYHGLQPVIVKDRVDNRINVEYERWNSHSRILSQYPVTGAPMLPAPSPTMPANLSATERYLDIDGDAATVMFGFDGYLDRVSFLKYDVTNVAYAIRDGGRAAIIGVGGGRDVLSAWLYGFRDITGVELNPIFVDLLTRYTPFADFAGLSRLPGVRFRVDEARSWFARTEDRFDLIQMSLIDTWAATGAGAFSLSENGLYTLEGWRHFVGALTPTGIFTVSRWYGPNALDETGRLVSLAARVLMDYGVSNPARHLALIANGRLATLILSRQPLTAADLASLHHVSDQMKFDIILAPDTTPGSPLLGSIVNAHNSVELASITSGLLFDLTPPTDDRPFFFNQLPLTRAWAAFNVGALKAAGVRSGNMLASLTLLGILIIATILVSIVIILPLRPAIRETSPRVAVAGTVYFLFLGLAFMFVEIGLLQRLSVFLGHPIYSLSIVLFSIIVFTGLGSLLSERWAFGSHREFAIWAILLAVYVSALPMWLPGLLARLESSGILLRGAGAVAIIAPAGLLMGFGFPTGMRMVLKQNPKPAPWFWGINGAAGVLGSVLAVAVGISFGINASLIVGAGFYVGLIPAAIIMRMQPKLRPGIEVVKEAG
jgi:hypothetical protein